MAKKIFYERRGRRYVPVAEYDQDYLDSFPKGNHLVMCYPGGQSRRYHIDPNYAAMIAAGRVAEDAISKKLMEASDLRMKRSDRERALTAKQKQAWENLVKEFGTSAKMLEWPSAREACEAGVDAMMREAEKLLSKPAVKLAFEHFLTVAALCKDEDAKI